MKRIIEHTGREDLVTKNTTTLSSKSMIDEDEYDIIDNEIGEFNNSFLPGSFGGSSHVDISLYQTRV